jgi:hypothetical protein
MITLARLTLIAALVFMALRPAHADSVLLKLKTDSGQIFVTPMDIQERCPEETMAMFDEANKKDIPVIIRIDNKRYEILEVVCIGQQKKPNGEKK